MTLTGYRYSIPFSAPLQNSATTYGSRNGLILHLKTDQHHFFGESAPLPGFSSYTVDDVMNQIQELAPQLQDIFQSQKPTKQLEKLYKRQEVYPTNEFALDTLACQIESYSMGISLCDYLFDEVPARLPVNATVSLISSNAGKKIDQFLARGYRTIKVKIGKNFKQEYERLNDIRLNYPNLSIRVDANRAWTLKGAIQNCQKLQELNLEYCEEPLQNPSVNNFRRLNEQTKVPLAIDESLLGCKDWKGLLPHTTFIILKPMVLGSLLRIFNISKEGQKHGNKIIITTCLETAIGRMMTANIAMGIGTKKYAHGLATASMLKNKVQPDHFLEDGVIHRSKIPSQIDISSSNLDPFKNYNFF